ncbi:MAG: glycosyltransferase [Solirubrobacterales bacterium]
MRVLITVPWGRRLGGAEEMLQMALDGAPASGHELELVFFEDGPWPEELRQAGFHVEVIPAGRIRNAPRAVATVVRLAGVLRARKPDLILNWVTKTHLYGAPAAILARMTDRVLWWQHGVPGGDWIDRWATMLPAIAIGCTSTAAARAQAQLFPSRPTFVVAAGARAPRERCGQGPLRLPADVPVVGIVGRLQPWKGQDRLLAAQAILRERGHAMQTVIVGGDAYGLSSDYADSLPAVAGHLGLSDAVTMTGQVPDAGPYIDQMDILVNASDPEPFGIVLLEGMARGVAVLAVDSGGPTDFIEDGHTGVLARSGNPEDLADALEPLLRSPALRERIATAGRERFLSDFTALAMCDRLFGHLETLIWGKDDVYS